MNRKEKMEKREEIKSLLRSNYLTQTWLIHNLERKGIKVDKTALSAILANARRGEKCDLVIDASLEILYDYKIKFGL